AEGRNVVISTGTASGKSFCYSLPIWQQLLKDPNSSALCFFPTKALTYDQFNSFRQFENQLFSSSSTSKVSVYDGDTPSAQRSAIREQTHILLTNPDMLHLGILPHHTLWERFLKNLRYVVIDEVHTYRGVFGSHIANLVRRLNRICAFYGAKPQFILTSATIGNPKELAENLIEAPVEWIRGDGSPKGLRNFLIYNPPIVNEELGIRQGLLDTASQLTTELVSNHIQTLAFCRTRKGVELLLRRAIERLPTQKSHLRAYRSGYLKAERRDIEAGLKNGEVTLAAATNALELGIDIGGVDAVLLVGYPGTIASTTQRAGRAGRKSKPSLAVMIASSAPLDQY
ncbi:DEAD/DEAH box helicase, partial [bacterium]|nr:DEAD/DEAH box helicase [bacterium]